VSKKAFKVDNSIVFRPNLAPVDPQSGEVYYDKETDRLNIRSANSWVSVDPLKLSFSIDQVNDFKIHDAVYWTGSQWALAKADNANTLATHIVNTISKTNVNKVELCSIGRFDYDDSFDIGMSVGHYYFLSDRYGANFIIKDNPVSVSILINNVQHLITGATVLEKLNNLISIVSSMGYRATGYGDVVAIETLTPISLLSFDNEVIKVSSSTTRLGFATPFKPDFGYDNLLFFIQSKKTIVYNCYRPVALGGISSTVNNLSTVKPSVLYTQDFESAKLSDFIQTGLSITTQTPMRGARSALLIHQDSITQSFKQFISVDRAFRGHKLKFNSLIQSTSVVGSISVKVDDETNSSNILTTILPHESFSVNNLSTNAGSTIISNFTFDQLYHEIMVGARITGPGIPPNTLVISKNLQQLSINISNAATITSISQSLRFSSLPKISEIVFSVPNSCETLSYTVTAEAVSDYPESYMDDIVIERLTEVDQTHISIPNLGKWNPYLPTTQGLGQTSDVDFKWRQVGENIEILGNFTAGITTADEARISLPNNLTTAGSPILLSATLVGSSSDASCQIATEPNVNYLFFVDYSTTSSLTRQAGDAIFSTGQQVSFFASVPCLNLSAESTRAVATTINYGGTIDVEYLTARSGSGSNSIISNFSNLTSTSLGILYQSESKITALKNCKLTINVRAVSGGSSNRVDIYKNGSIYSRGIEADIGSALLNTITVKASTGDCFEVFSVGAIANTQIEYDATAEINSDQILVPSESFSTDTASLRYAGSAEYTLSTLANAPVGTFITFTYAANTNTRTQTVNTPPNQSTADMNVNGIQLFTRAYNAPSTAGSPAAFAIQIGKGFKGKSLDLYKSAGKAIAGSLDLLGGSGLSIQRGIAIKDYNEVTGILVVDVGWTNNTSVTVNNFLFSDISDQTSGYLVINASKSPALTGVPLVQPRIATLSDVKLAGTSGGTAVINVWTARDLNTLNDPTGIVSSLSSNGFELTAGTYKISALSPLLASANSAGRGRIKLRNTTNSTDTLLGMSGRTSMGTSDGILFLANLNGTFTITSTTRFEIQYFVNLGQADSLGVATTDGLDAVYTTVVLEKIK